MARKPRNTPTMPETATPQCQGAALSENTQRTMNPNGGRKTHPIP